ncbi:MAG: UvrD-helicase domain-containing protein [Planctomycetota bacterium]
MTPHVGDDFLRQTYGKTTDPAGATPSPHAVIRASAGAGKTYQLTTRYLRLLRAGASPPTILATTFTRKAAGEILQRVLGRLAKACRSEEERAKLEADLGGFPLSSAECLSMLRRLVETLHRLAISTIDSFFNRAAGALRFELGLPADPRLTDEGSPLSRRLRLEAIQAQLGDALASDGGLQTLIELLRRLHHDTTQRSVTDALDTIAQSLYDIYRQYPDPELWANVDYHKPLGPELLAISIESRELAAASLPKAKRTGKTDGRWAEAYRQLLERARGGMYEAVLSNGLVKAMPPAGGGKYYRIMLPEELIEAIRPIKAHAAASVVHDLLGQTRATHQLLAGFHGHYERLRRRERVLLFSDLTHLLARYAPDDDQDAFLSELYYRLDAQVTHLLLDEFQDTSLDQWDVIRGFASEIAAVGDGQRSVFCVGDVKQAIYGWRGGCAEIFDEIERLPGLEDKALSSLTKSYRSSQVVLDLVNRVFGDLPANAALADTGAAANLWQGYYQKHQAAKDLPGHVVLHSTRSSGGKAALTGRRDEDAALGLDSDPHWVYTAGYIESLHQAIPGRSIGVLMRRRKSAAPLLHALRNLGVDVSEEGGNPVDNVPAVAAVLSAIRLADHPADAAAAYHVINSPLGHLVGLDSRNERDAAAVAGRLRRDLMDHGYSAVIARWTRALAGSCDERSLRRLQQLVELAEQHDADGGLRPGQFVDAVRSARVEDPSAAPVRVMTIHAAKGLEFDAVVLPELHGRLNANDQRDLLLVDRPSPIDPPTNIMRRPNKVLTATIADLELAMARAAAEQRGEDLSLLYVAMTRPRHALHLLVPPATYSDKGKQNKTHVSDLSYAAMLRQALGVSAEQDPAEGGATLYERGDAAWAKPTLSPLAKAPAIGHDALFKIELAQSHAAVPRRSWAEASPSKLSSGGHTHAADLLGLGETGGLGWGSAIHALYEQIGFIDEQPIPDDRALASILQGVAPSVDGAAVIAAIRRQLDVPAIREALMRHGADELWRERSFLVPADGRLLRGQFDRVLIWRDSGGAAVRARLIDFKTDRIDYATLADRVADYRGQIAGYRVALATMLGIHSDAVEAALVFLGDGRVVAVDTDR